MKPGDRTDRAPQAPAVPAESHPAGLPSLRTLLIWVVIAAVAPAAVIIAAFVLWHYQIEQEQRATESLAAVRVLSGAVDDRLQGIQGQLSVLAGAFPASGALGMREFYEQARQLANAGQVDAIVLVEASGRQVLSTRLPYGQAVPIPGPPNLLGTLRAGRTMVNDLFIGAVLQRPMVGVGVPVIVGQELRYALNASLEVARFRDLLLRQRLPAGGMALISDSRGTVVASSSEHEQLVGTALVAPSLATLRAQREGFVRSPAVNGADAMTYFHSSPMTGWSVLLQVPVAQLHVPHTSPILAGSLGLLLVLGLSVLVAWRMNARIIASIASLRQLAGRLALGERVQLAPVHFAEAVGLARAYQDAAESLRASNDSLQEREQRLRAILETAMDSVITVDPEQNIVLVNEAAERMFGRGRDQLVGRPILLLIPERFHPVHAENVRHFAREAARARPVGLGDRFLHGRRANGEEFPVEGSISSSQDRNGRRLYTVIMRDVTERRRDHEALVRSNLELQQFAFVASHDLRTPLRIIKGYLQVLLARLQGAQPEAVQLIGRASQAVDQMDALTADLLSYARLHSDAKPFATVSMNAVVTDALAQFDAVLAERHARVSVAALPQVHGDRTQLVQLWQNLLANALKYCERPPSIRIGVHRAAHEWVFQVSDNGIGIEPQYLERIFEIFQRLHGQHEYPGSGVGLAICRRVVQRHGGRLWAESVPGQGSTFYFTLPIPESSTCT